MIKIINPVLSPAIEVKEAIIDIDNSLVLVGKKPIPPLVFNDAFYWMIEVWIKENNLLFEIDRCKAPFASEEGIRVFGTQLSEIEYFINNLE